MSATNEKDIDGDIISKLSVVQRQEFMLLIASCIKKQRLALTRWTRPSESSTRTPLELAAIKSFESWRVSVLSRLSEVLQAPAPNYQATATAAPTGIPEPRSFLHRNYTPVATPLAEFEQPELLLQSLLLVLLGLKSYDARSRVLLLRVASSLNLSEQTLNALEASTSKTLLAAATKMSADAESASRAEAAKKANRWKIGIASVAGAALIGVTGGLAAPIVAAGLGSVMGGLGLGAVAGLLGGVAGSSVLAGALFGAYGGRMGGQMMERYAKEVEDFSFIPVAEGEQRLRVAVGVTGWVVDGEEEVLQPWMSLGGGTEAYALRWEVDALTELGTALDGVLKSYAMSWVKIEIIKHTVFATLYSMLWPLALLKAARVVDNPFSVAMHRSEKAGLVLADAIINKAQGERPITLVGYSLGARVIYSCLTSLAERGQFGLVENVVLMGAPIPADADTWRKMRAVVAGRVVNVFSGQDYVLAFLYRTSKIQFGVAGLQKVEVPGVQSVDAGELVAGHLMYRHAVARILRDVLQGDVDIAVVEREEAALKRLEESEKLEKEKVEKEQEEKKMEQDAKKMDEENQQRLQRLELKDKNEQKPELKEHPDAHPDAHPNPEIVPEELIEEMKQAEPMEWKMELGEVETAVKIEQAGQTEQGPAQVEKKQWEHSPLPEEVGRDMDEVLSRVERKLAMMRETREGPRS
ncbi:hypothetical protein FN846DRAFT_924394 [Sphaerosporella brunnea]|uniref:DUF726-domain-containing protein n=1 Tax=Sphaerosporella brunnea TaxID=1250544 RepID=A0A5J5FCA1_9PEZI|nr:hypothetical protein FN846DRAFT_924394 [Sphaerosporella brunnea]